MSAVRCTDCGAVWLTSAAHVLMEGAGGCLRCDGELQPMTDREVDDYLKDITSE